MRALILAATAAILTAGLSAQLHPCQFHRIDPTCGPVLAGHDVIGHRGNTQFHSITFKASHAPARAIGVLAFSFHRARFQFPGTRCFILIKPDANLTVPFHTDAHGVPSWPAVVAATLKGTVYAQSAFVTRGHLITSNALEMQCR